MRTSLLPALLGLLVAAPPAAAYEPTGRYREKEVQGFALLLAPEVVAQKPDLNALLREVDVELERVTRVVPDKALKSLRKVPIWFEWDADAANAVARFFPGSSAVKKLDLNPGKANAIEVPNAKRFLKARQAGAEWVLMHELAHAYHFLALDKRDGNIEATFKQAVERKLYDDVEHFNGVRARGYAVTNHYEYFATLTEAYFGKSFNFPYDRSGLLRYDTAGYWLMQECWGKPK